MKRLFPSVIAVLGVSLFLMTGCNPKKDKDIVKPAAKKGMPHDHADTGPHKGALGEWGDDEYHFEFTVDHEKKQATIYILDGTAAKAAPIAGEEMLLILTHEKTPIKIALKAEREKDDPEGKSSRYVGVHDALGVEMEFKGEVSGKVGATPYRGDFAEKAGHDHVHKK